MLKLLELDIDRNLLDFIVQTTIDTIAFAYNGPSTSQSRGRSTSRSNKHAAFAEFASNVVLRSEVTIGVLLAALVYIERSRPHLCVETEEWACERVFLGALMVASKYTNDSTLKNVHWALVTGTFGKRDVGRIEREFLDVLDWELGVSEAEILEFYDSLITLHPRAHLQISSSPVEISTPCSLAQSDEYSSWSDSDSDDSSSPCPLTPSTPVDHLEFVKSPRHQPKLLSHMVDFAHLFSDSPTLVPVVTVQVVL
jgi:hypothetical protein